MTQQPPPPLPDPDLAIDDSRDRGAGAPKRNTTKVLLIVGACCLGGLFLLAILAAILIPAIFGATEQANRRSAPPTSSRSASPARPGRPGTSSSGPRGSRRNRPPGTMWATRGSPKTHSDRTAEPVNSNTAGLWMLAKAGLVQNTAVFICPSTEHRQEVSIADWHEFARPRFPERGPHAVTRTRTRSRATANNHRGEVHPDQRRLAQHGRGGRRQPACGAISGAARRGARSRKGRPT